MRISLIVAVDRLGGIGKDNRVPWHLRADLQRFKALTIGHHLIIGRKTWESIGRPLPGRKMVVVSRNPAYILENCLDCAVAASLGAALALAEDVGDDEAFVGGGSEIFALALPLAGRIYLTEVDAVANCDVFFPALNWDDWRDVERQEIPADEHNQYASIYRVLERAGGKE